MQAFARFSTADKAVSPASMHNLLGASWTGFGSRRSDSAGFALLQLLPTLDGVALKAENAFEVFYKLPLARHLAMKMDLQHVRRPGGMGEAPSFAVASIRLFVNFSTGGEDERN